MPIKIKYICVHLYRDIHATKCPADDGEGKVQSSIKSQKQHREFQHRQKSPQNSNQTEKPGD